RVAGGDSRTGFLAKRDTGCGDRVAAEDLFRRDETGADKSLRQRRGHLASAKKSEGELRRHGGFYQFRLVSGSEIGGGPESADQTGAAPSPRVGDAAGWSNPGKGGSKGTPTHGVRLRRAR